MTECDTAPDAGGAPQGPALRLLVAAVYAVEILWLADHYSDGELSRRARRAIASLLDQIMEPMRRRRDITRAERHVVFEAMQIVEGGADDRHHQ